MITRKHGFSLIELMVVVAIIGILSTLAIPSYQKFKARSRQTSAKTELSSIFTVEQGFKAEFGIYCWDLPALGFLPQDIDSDWDANGDWLARSTRYYGSTAGSNVLGTDNFPVDCYLPTYGLNSTQGRGKDYYNNFEAAASKCAALSISASGSQQVVVDVDLGMGSPGSISNSTFDARVIGCPLKNIPAGQTVGLDRWSINQNRVMTNLNSGL